jgi:protein-arginine kinase
MTDVKIKIATKFKSSVTTEPTVTIPAKIDTDIVGAQVVEQITDQVATTEIEGNNKFTGLPIMKFEIKTGSVLIYRTLKGDGLWVTGETKEHKHVLKNAGGTWNAKMCAWLFNLPAKYILVPYFMDKSLGL